MTTLAELCTSVDYGYTASASDDPAVGPKFLRITDIVPDLIDWSTVPHCEIEDGKRDKFLLDASDIVIARTGATVGYAKQIWARPEGATFASYLVRFRPDPSRVDPNYLGQVVQSTSFKKWVKSVAGGAAQPNASAKLLGTFEVPLPSPDNQRQIGAALRAITELIENNRRRIEIVEEMARLIYREWFVHFRFPGPEDVDLVDSDLGPIPEGWEAARLGDIASYINRGIAPKYDQDSWPLVINQRCIHDHRVLLDVARRHITKVSEDKFVRVGDMLVNSTGVGTLGRVGPVRVKLDDTTVDSHVTIVRPQAEININYFAELVLSLEPLFESMGVGSTGQTELSRARVGEAQVVVAPKPLRDSYGDLVSPMSHLAVSLIRQSEVLAKARDLLLPRLISGELDVSGLDLDLEPVA